MQRITTIKLAFYSYSKEGEIIGEIVLKNSRCTLLQGDCLEIMKELSDESVDMVLCDLPYGSTKCKWDTIIPFNDLWSQYKRIIKNNGAILLFGNEPFSSSLRISNLSMYRYDWIWQKDRQANFLFANKQPLKRHETISVYYKAQPTYNPQMIKGKVNHKSFKNDSDTRIDYREGMDQLVTMKQPRQDGMKYPISIIDFKCLARGKNVHPTQKPVDLLEYLIRTYTNEGETILDNCMGSGSTGVAALNINRRFIGIELDPTYCGIAKQRIQDIEAKYA